MSSVKVSGFANELPQNVPPRPAVNLVVMICWYFFSDHIIDIIVLKRRACNGIADRKGIWPVSK